jgi:PST family polysaccharide transporter
MKRSLAFVYAAFFLRYVYPLVLVPFYARVLGVSEYGRLLTALSLTTVVWGVLDYGFLFCGAREAASAPGPKELAAVYGRHLAGRLTMLLPGLALGAAGTFATPVLRERPLLGILATIGGVIASLNLGWYFQGTLRFVTSVILEVLGLIINLPLVLWLVRDQNDGSVVLWINVGSSLTAAGIAHLVALRSVDRSAVRLRGGLSLVREATPLFAHRGFGMLVQSGAIYIVGMFANAQGAGLYGSAEKLVGLGVSALTPASQVMLGTVSKRLANGGEGFYPLIRKAMFAMLMASVTACAGAMVLTKYAIPIALGPGFEEVEPIVKVLAFILPFSAMNQVMSNYVLIPLRQDRFVSSSSLIALLVAVPLMLMLASHYGLVGTGIARVIAEATSTGFLASVLYRKQLWAPILSAGRTQDGAPVRMP